MPTMSIHLDGAPGLPLSQAADHNELAKYVKSNEQNSLSQALNKAFDGRGKATGPHTFAGQPVMHASSGTGNKSVCLFWYEVGDNMALIALGEHVPPTSKLYQISIGQPGGDYRAKKIGLP